ncbi:MAG: phosphoribosylamine--glycine ligase, partial [Candidatus Diapherotrites archaeon]|nr:phosphoribosylamine--glycine ligase [Candidatus Diapherotrites archaeon]
MGLIFGMEPKNFLFYSSDASCVDIAWHVKKEGNNVKMYVKDVDYNDTGLGFVDKVDDWEKELDWADIIVFDDSIGQGKLAKSLRDKGKLVVGGTPNTELLEADREFGQDQLRKVGVNTIPSKMYTSFDEAIDFVKQNPGKYVIKPSGNAQTTKR